MDACLAKFLMTTKLTKTHIALMGDPQWSVRIGLLTKSMFLGVLSSLDCLVLTHRVCGNLHYVNLSGRLIVVSSRQRIIYTISIEQQGPTLGATFSKALTKYLKKRKKYGT